MMRPNSAKRVLACVLALAFFLSALPAALGLEVEEVISNVEKSEKAIGVLRAKFELRWEKSGGTIQEGEWGRKGDKEYARYFECSKDAEGRAERYEVIEAFDGKKLRSYQPAIMGGSVREPGADMYDEAEALRLLGYSLVAKRGMTLAGALRESQIEIVSTDSMIDGRAFIEMKCDVPDVAMGPEGTLVDETRYATVWIDSERDWRIVRWESYRDWERTDLCAALERVRLEKTDGVWLPMSGAFSLYERKPIPLDGYTIEELQAMPREEALKHVRFESVPAFGQMQLILIESWHVGGDIDDGVFTIRFPVGADVWDESAKREIHIWRDTGNL